MLKKYSSWLTSTGLLLVFSIVILPKEFQIIVDWFAPIAGVTLGPTLAIVFLLFASGLRYPLVFTSWTVSGFFCGVVARGSLKRTLVVSLSVFFTLILILGGNVYPIVWTVNPSGLSNIPQPPPGAALTDILSLPLVSDVASGIMGSQGVSLIPILTMLISSLIVNLATLCIFSFLGSLIMMRLIPRIRKRGRLSSAANLSEKALVAATISMVLLSPLPLAAYTSPNLDFTILDVWVPGQPDPNHGILLGKDVSIYISIRNTGNASIDDIRFGLNAHVGIAFNITSSPQHVILNNLIKPGKYFNFSAVLNVPSTALAGSYAVDVVVEAHASETEVWVTREYCREESFIVSSASGVSNEDSKPFTTGSGESLSLNVKDDGSLSVAYVFGGLDLVAKGIRLSEDDLNGILFAGFAVRQGEIQTLGGMESLVSFLPEMGFVVIYTGLGSEEAKVRGDQLSSQFGSALKVQFTETSTLEIPVEGQSMSVIIYSPPAGFTYEQGLNAYLSLLPSNGLSKLLVADRILQRPFFVFVGLGSGFSQKEDNKITSFAETFIDWRGETFGGTGRFYLSLKDILGFSEKITSNIPNGSVIVMSLPESLNITSLNIEPADARIIDNTVMLLVNSSDAYDDLKVSFEARFPPSVTATKDVQPSIASVEGVVSITIEVRNLGNVPVTNVEVNDEDALNVYSSTLTVISGSPKASWGLLSGNESKVMTYSVKLGANGKYTLKPAEVSYNDQYGHYTRQSETTVITSEFNVAVYLQRLFIIPLTIDTVNLSPSLQQLLKFNPFLTALIFMIVLPPVVELVRRAIQRHKPKESKPPKEEVV